MADHTTHGVLSHAAARLAWFDQCSSTAALLLGKVNDGAEEFIGVGRNSIDSNSSRRRSLARDGVAMGAFPRKATPSARSRIRDDFEIVRRADRASRAMLSAFKTAC